MKSRSAAKGAESEKGPFVHRFSGKTRRPEPLTAPAKLQLVAAAAGQPHPFVFSFLTRLSEILQVAILHSEATALRRRIGCVADCLRVARVRLAFEF